MYQAGYLTIKRARRGIADLGIPNLEVKQAFAGIIMHKLTHQDGQKLRIKYLLEMDDALVQHDYQTLRQIFNQYLNEFSPEAFLRFNEAAFRDLFKVFLVLMNCNAYSEYPTASGRSDLCFSTEDALYAFEFQLAAGREQVEKKLKEACAQVKSRRYAVRLSGQQVIPIAAVIVNEKASDGKTSALRELAALEPVL